MKRMLCILSFIALVPGLLWAADNSEKIVIIKGIQIGMPAADAKAAIDRALKNGWTASGVGDRDKLLGDKFYCDEEIFGESKVGGTSLGGMGGGSSYGVKAPPNVGRKGILIKHDNYFQGGFISIDDADTVSQISFGGKLVNDMLSTEDITADDFVKAFMAYFNLPEFYWVSGGWKHESRHNYVIHITTKKRVDIKKETHAYNQKPLVEFN